MQHVTRLILLPLLAAAMTGGGWAKEDAKKTAPAAEYKRSDANFYPKGDVVKAHPTAVILAKGEYTVKLSYAVNGASYFFTPHQKAPKEIYVEVLPDWI